jgi:hypothetical protein
MMTKKKNTKKETEETAFTRSWCGSRDDAYHDLCTIETIEHVQKVLNEQVKETLSEYFVIQDGQSVYMCQDSENPSMLDYFPEDLAEKQRRGAKIRKRAVPRMFRFYKTAKELELLFDNQQIWYPKEVFNKRSNKWNVDWSLQNIINIWKSLEDRPTYKSLVFMPYRHGANDGGLKEKGVYNSFQGWGCDPLFDKKGNPVPEKCYLIKSHLYHVLCQGETHVYKWVMQWLAHKVQHPAKKIGTAIGIQSGQGGGKGTFVRDVLGEIISPSHFIHTKDIHAITGRFTNTENTILTFLDEALFVHDKRVTDQLKAIVTETSLQVEQKYRDSKSVYTVNDYIFCTNNNIAAPIENDDRRYCVLTVPNPNKSTQELDDYFTALHHEINNEGLEAFFGVLLTHEYDPEINIHKAPRTKSTDEQKAMNMSIEEQWWFRVLDDEIWGQDFTAFNNPKQSVVLELKDHIDGSIPKSVIYQSYKEFVTDMPGFKHAKNSSEIFKMLENMCPAIIPTSKKITMSATINMPLSEIVGEGRRVHCVDLPSLHLMKEQFQDYSHVVKGWNAPSDEMFDDDTPAEFVNHYKTTDVPF